MRKEMSEDKQFIFDSIFTQVRSGFYSLEEIQISVIEDVEYHGFGDEISEKWIQEQIQIVNSEFLEEYQHRERPTDTERLIEVFDELASKHKIIALHDPGFITEDSEYEVADVERTLNDNEAASEGYCFYNGEDLDAAVRGEKLLLNFQKIDNTSDATSKEIARKIIEVLQNHGLKTTWDGKATSPIVLPGFKWERVYDENARDLHDNNYVIDAILDNH